MPFFLFPAIPLAASAIIAAGGAIVAAFKVKEAMNTNDRANSVAARASSNHDEALACLERARGKTQRVLTDLGSLKAHVFGNQIRHLVLMHKKFRSELRGFRESFDIRELDYCEKMAVKSLSMSQFLADGAGAAARGAFAVYGATGILGTLNAGRLVVSLSGAAASRSSLVFLGGGAATAGSSLLLGSLVLGPALAAAGFRAAGRANENLTKAYAYEKQVEENCEEINLIRVQLKAIRTAAAEQGDVICRLREHFDRYRVNTMRDREAFRRMLLIGKGLKAALDVPVLDRDGRALPDIKARMSGCLRLGLQ